MIILYSILFILLLIGLLLLALYFYQKDFIEWHNGEIRGATKEARLHKLARDIEREFRKLDKVKGLSRVK